MNPLTIIRTGTMIKGMPFLFVNEAIFASNIRMQCNDLCIRWKCVNLTDLSLVIATMMGNRSRLVSDREPQSHSSPFVSSRVSVSTLLRIYLIRFSFFLWSAEGVLFCEVFLKLRKDSVERFWSLVLVYERSDSCAVVLTHNNASRSCTLRFADYFVTFVAGSG